MTEREAVRLMGVNGTPLSCHLMLSSGPRASMGLPSPSSRRIEEGDRFTTAYGVWGALNCRAGFVVRDENGLPEGIRDYVEGSSPPTSAPSSPGMRPSASAPAGASSTTPSTGTSAIRFSA